MYCPPDFATTIAPDGGDVRDAACARAVNIARQVMLTFIFSILFPLNIVFERCLFAIMPRVEKLTTVGKLLDSCSGSAGQGTFFIHGSSSETML